jgi:hypothetical protein
VPAPRVVNGIEQRPIEGTSMVYSFDSKIHPQNIRPSILKCLVIALFTTMAGLPAPFTNPHGKEI